MSTSSRTPDDKMHRYLQRIQKLVGHRPKSPTIVKSRLKSPINIKTPKLDSLIRHEMFIKAIINFCHQQYNKWRLHFIDQLTTTVTVAENQKKVEKELKPIKSISKSLISKREDDKSFQIRFMTKPLQTILLRIKKEAYFQIKQHTKQSQILTRDIKPTLKNLHRRTYSQIYAQSVKSHYKSPSPIRQYEYKTPSVLIKRPSAEYPYQKNVQTKLFCCILQKLQKERIHAGFSAIKSVHVTKLSVQMQHLYHQIQTLSQQLSSVRNQISMINEERNEKSRLLEEKQKEIGFVLSKLNQENQQIHSQEIAQLQITIDKNHATFSLFQTINNKYLIFAAQSFQNIKTFRQNTLKDLTKYFFLTNIFKNKVKSLKKDCFNKLCIQSAFISIQDAQKQRSQTPSVIKIQSLYSSKLSNASLKSSSSNFEILANKINKAFELKTTLTEIYSFGFQKIDYAALMYLSISSPLQKYLNKSLKQSFRKILFFSFQKSQYNQPDSRKNINQQATNKFWTILERLSKKQLFIKIQAYSLIKLNFQLKKTVKLKDAVIIEEVQLRKQIKDFLQQRNKMHQKACQTWQKTKDLLKQTSLIQSKITASSRSLI